LGRWCFGDAPAIKWVRAIDLGVAMSRHPLGEGEPEILADAKESRFVTLDDLGWESQRGIEVVLEVIAHRYDTGLHTALTSGLTWDALVARYGEAVIRRPLEAGGAKGRLIDLHKKGDA
jgi:DNA replication protein DnaC